MTYDNLQERIMDCMNDMHEAQTLTLSAYSQWNKTGIRGWNASQRNLRLDNHYTASVLKYIQSRNNVKTMFMKTSKHKTKLDGCKLGVTPNSRRFDRRSLIRLLISQSNIHGVLWSCHFGFMGVFNVWFHRELPVFSQYANIQPIKILLYIRIWK